MKSIVEFNISNYKLSKEEQWNIIVELYNIAGIDLDNQIEWWYKYNS